METPIFVFTGFIDSGKTTLLRDTLESPDFKAKSNLIIVCEEGDEEFEDAFISRNNAYLEYIQKPEDLTDEFLESLAKKYKPEQVFIEYNGTWEMKNILERKLPKKWEWGGIYSTVDGTTVDTYLSNMRQLFMEQFVASGLIIVNRCEESLDRVRVRRIFKGFNPSVQLIFEKPNGDMYDPSEDPLPYDINADIIEIEPLDYGIFYIDAMEHPENYINKHIKFLAQLYRGSDLPPQTFVPGRFIMTCCEADIRFMGYLCEFDGEFPYKQRDWINIEVLFDYKFVPSYGEKAPILKLLSATPTTRPEVDPVFFS